MARSFFVVLFCTSTMICLACGTHKKHEAQSPSGPNPGACKNDPNSISTPVMIQLPPKNQFHSSTGAVVDGYKALEVSGYACPGTSGNSVGLARVGTLDESVVHMTAYANNGNSFELDLGTLRADKSDLETIFFKASMVVDASALNDTEILWTPTLTPTEAGTSAGF